MFPNVNFVNLAPTDVFQSRDNGVPQECEKVWTRGRQWKRLYISGTVFPIRSSTM